MVEAILLLHTDFRKCSGGVEKILDASRHLLAVQNELNLNYMAEFSSVMLSLFPILVQSELEHEQYPVLQSVLFLLRWKSEKGKVFCSSIMLWLFSFCDSYLWGEELVYQNSKTLRLNQNEFDNHKNTPSFPNPV